MEKLLTDLKAVADDLRATGLKAPHLSVVESLLAAAIERLGLHLEQVANQQAQKEAAQSPATAPANPTTSAKS